MNRTMDGKARWLMVLCLAGSSLGTPALAAEGWLADKIQHTPWRLSDDIECAPWSPRQDEVDWGQSLSQRRNCTVNEQRDVIFYERHSVTGEIRERSREHETRFQHRRERRLVKGQRDRLLNVDHQREWSDWLLIPGTRRDCTELHDLSAHHDLNQPLLRVAQCQQQAGRHKAVVEHWLSGKRVRLQHLEPKESRWQPVTALNWTLGQRDRWLPAVTKYGPWQEVEGQRRCDGWLGAPVAEGLPWGVGFADWRYCQIDQQRKRYQISSALSGKQRRLSTTAEDREVRRLQVRLSRGEQDRVISQQRQISQPWQALPDSEQCSPLPDIAGLIPWDQNYLLYQACQIDEQQRDHLVSRYASGHTELSDQRQQRRQRHYHKIAGHLGQLDEWLSDSEELRLLGWEQDGAEQCQPWLPASPGMPVSWSYTQVRECRQSQRQRTERLTHWRSGDKWVAGEPQQRQISRFETRFAQGMRLHQQALEPWVVQLEPGQRYLAPARSVNDGLRYQRLKVELQLAEGAVLSDHQMLSIAIRGPRGGMISLPTLSRKRQAFYFNLADYQLADQGEWTLLITDGRTPGDAGMLEVTARLILEQRPATP